MTNVQKNADSGLHIIRLVATNDRGMRIGEYHQRAKHSDALVEQARQMHDDGMGYRRIARKLGVPLGTVRNWCGYNMRTQAYGRWKRV